MEDVRVESRVEKLAKLVHSPSNPRLIKNKKHRALVKSLQDFPEMSQLREIVIDEDFMILAGDKRAYAYEELGYTDVRIKQVWGLSDSKKREFIAKDNIHQGEWDPDIIANEWDSQLLKDWGATFKTGMDDDDSDSDTPSPKTNHDIECPNCGFTFDPKEK